MRQTKKHRRSSVNHLWFASQLYLQLSEKQEQQLNASSTYINMNNTLGHHILFINRFAWLSARLGKCHYQNLLGGKGWENVEDFACVTMTEFTRLFPIRLYNNVINMFLLI